MAATAVTRVFLADGSPLGHLEGFHDPRWLKSNDVFGLDGIRLPWNTKLPEGLVFEQLPPGGKVAKGLRAMTKAAYEAKEARERVVRNATLNAATAKVYEALAAAGLAPGRVGGYGHGSMSISVDGVSVSIGLTAHFHE
jgi:hypothetical protein